MCPNEECGQDRWDVSRRYIVESLGTLDINILCTGRISYSVSFPLFFVTYPSSDGVGTSVKERVGHRSRVVYRDGTRFPELLMSEGHGPPVVYFRWHWSVRHVSCQYPLSEMIWLGHSQFTNPLSVNAERATLNTHRSGQDSDRSTDNGSRSSVSVDFKTFT